MALTEIALNIGTWILGKVADKGFDSLYSKIADTDAVNKKFKKALENVSSRFQDKYPDLLGGSIEAFFKKEEVFNELFKLLFRISKIDEVKIESVFDTTTLPEHFIKDFIVSLKEELLKDKLFDELLSNNELYVVFQGMGLDLRTVADNSKITAKKIALLSKIVEDRFGNTFDLSEFKILYSKNALNNLSQVNFIGLGIDISIKKNRKELTDIFVHPSFRATSLRGELGGNIRSFRSSITYNDLFKISNRLVILGNPGSGKSIVVKSIICDILKGENEKFDGELSGKLPFRIELRKYLAYKQGNGGNLVKYLIWLLENEYQISNISEPIMDSLLSKQECIILFDGLDEIFDVKDKINIKNDIENFHNSFPKIYSVTTSRIIGYEEASLSEQFIPIYIQNFDDIKIEEYLRKWYSKEEHNEEIREREIDGFLSKKHEIDYELISNPLLLSLIVILYRNILKLPESKLEIYQSCTKTLVDKWDASKDLIINLDSVLLKERDKLFADLAHWQYLESSSSKANITYNKAKQTIVKSIIRLDISGEGECENLAEKFMEYAQKRSLYFDNNFTHKTFLEYYTVYWIYSNIEKKHKVEERDNLLKQYIGNTYWYIVLELLLNLIDKDQADNEIIDALFNRQIDESSYGLPFLINISLKLKNISSKTIQRCITEGLAQIKPFDHSAARNRKESIFNSLASAFRQNSKAREFVLEELTRLESLHLNDIEKLKDIYILYIELVDFIHNTHKEFELGNEEMFTKVCKMDAYLFTISKAIFLDYPERMLNNLNEFIELFGKDKIFESIYSKYDAYELTSYFMTFIMHALEHNHADLDEALLVLTKNGISKKMIIKNMYRDETHYFIDSEASEAIFEEFNKNLDPEISEILLLGLKLTDSKINEFNLESKTLVGAKKKLFDKVFKKIK